MIAVGEVLTREDGRKFKVVGRANGDWIAEPLDAFGPPVALTPDELSAALGIPDAAPPVQPDEQAGWEALATAHRRLTEANSNGACPRGLTPEDVFAAAATQPKPTRRRHD
jgi:hypothetical protein